jgi:hypothetical protein
MNNEQMSLQTKAAFDAASEPSIESVINLTEASQITLDELKKRNAPVKVRYKLAGKLDVCNGANEEVYLFNQLNCQ